MQSVAQGWLVVQLTNSAFLLGLVGAVASSPMLVFSLFGGVMADRVNKRKMLVVTQSSMTILAFVLATLTATEVVRIWHILILAALLGIANAFDAPTRQSFVVEMVGKEDLLNAIALNSSMFNAARVLGPAIAGMLISFTGVAGCFYINGLSFIPVIIGLLLIRQTVPVHRAEDDSVWRHFLEGLRYVRSQRSVLALVSLTAIMSIFGMPYAVLMPFFARNVLNVGASGLGILMAATGTGALLGALSLATVGNYPRKGRLVLLGGMLFSVFAMLFSLCRVFPLSLVLLVGLGGSMVAQNATVNSLLQSIVPDQLRGRVMSVFTFMFMGMMPFGSLQAGTVATHFGAPFAVFLGGAVTLACMLIVHWRVPEIRKL
jgi:MFS family permease